MNITVKGSVVVKAKKKILNLKCNCGNDSVIIIINKKKMAGFVSCSNPICWHDSHRFLLELKRE